MFSSSQVPAKKEVHNLIFPNNPQAGIILLPAAEAADFKNLCSRGAIDSHTNILMVERDGKAFEFMKNSVKKTYCQSKNLNFIHNHLHRVSIPFPIDLAFIDFCGNIGRKEYDWLKFKLSPKIINGGSVSITIALPIRQTNFITSYIGSRWIDCKYEYLQMINYIRDQSECAYEREIAAYYVMLKEIFPQCHMDKLQYRSKKYTMVVFQLTDIVKD